MSQRLKRVFAILVISSATFTMLLCGSFLYNRFLFDKPLENNITKLSSIGSFKYENLNTKSKITVQFNVAKKLRTSFYQLLEQIDNQLDDSPDSLIIEIDNVPNESLGNFLREARLPVHEAMSTGEFTTLPEKLEQLAEAAQVYFELELDNDFVFLTAAADSAAAHLVIARGDSPVKVVTTMGGEYL